MHSPNPSPAIRPSRALRRSGGKVATRLAAALLLVGLVAATASAADPAPTPPDTLTARIHTATSDGAVVDATAYARPAEVHLVARVCERDAEPLPAGDYYFGVFDAEGGLRSTDELADRRFTVDSQGWITRTGGTHPTTRTICPGNGGAFVTIAAAPFDIDSTAATDVLWLRVAARAGADACVRSGDPTGFGCEDVQRASVAFSIDPAASPTPPPAATESPAPSPSGPTGASPSGSPDGSPGASASASAGDGASPAPTGSDEPGGSPTASPGGSGPTAAPSGGESPGTSPSAAPSGSGVPGASPTPTPVATGTPPATPGPTPTPPPAGAGPTPAPTPPQVAPGTAGAPWTGSQSPPSFVPYSLPPGAFVCPGQIITPTGCQPLDGSGGTGGATPMPSWSWGPVPSGAPIFPGIGTSIGGTSDPLAPVGGAPAGAVTRGAVEAAVDILGPFTQPSGLTGSPGGSPSASLPSGSASPSSAPTTGTASVGAGGSQGPTGDVAAATGLAQDGSLPPQPAPTASITTPSPPALPLVLAIVLLALVGASAAAAVGWARRGVSHGVSRPARTTFAADGSPLASAVRRVRRGLGRETGTQP